MWGLSQNMVYFQRRPLCLLDLKLYQNHIISCQISSQISNFSIWNLIAKSHFMTFHDLQTWWTFQSFRCFRSSQMNALSTCRSAPEVSFKARYQVPPGQFCQVLGPDAFLMYVSLSLSICKLYIYHEYCIYIYSQCLFDLFSSPTRCVFFCC